VLELCIGLYAKGRVTGHKRGKRNVRTHTSLIQIEGVANKEEAQFYLGKVRHNSMIYRDSKIQEIQRRGIRKGFPIQQLE
jgi:ribosomal protein L35AE/L33A